MKFFYQGPVSASKSIMNRALIVQSYEPRIKVVGTSECEDVRLMNTALEALRSGERNFECGNAGTVFRFLALRVSRERGEWVLRGSPRLMSRPHGGLLKILQQFGVEARVVGDELRLQSNGWKPVDEIAVDATESSQFLSSLILNAWNLPFDLNINLSRDVVSENYFHLTRKVAGHFGMNIVKKGSDDWRIPADQEPRPVELGVEPDVSSCFALAACAIFAGELQVENFPQDPWQPDAYFRDILTTMGANWSQQGPLLVVRQSPSLNAMSVDIKNCPDLFPVLAVLLAQGAGISRVSGTEHLRHKESNRLENTRLLLEKLERPLEITDKDVMIHGQMHNFTATGDFDPDQDHRMAMAAQVANFGGAKFNILNKDVVKKSFPEFWAITGSQELP